MYVKRKKTASVSEGRLAFFKFDFADAVSRADNHFAGSATGVNWPMGLSLIEMSS